jgi:protein-S-isoprenylcysteine O-methyltransferase Ste14
MDRPALVVTIVPPIALAVLMYEAAGPPWDAMRISGLVLIAFGLIFLTIARVQLGNAFSVTPQARILVTRGIYSRVRHPVYVFSAIAISGLILYLRQPIFLLVLLVLVPVQVMRAREEQRLLEEKFGDEYRRYKRDTWF